MISVTLPINVNDNWLRMCGIKMHLQTIHNHRISLSMILTSCITWNINRNLFVLESKYARASHVIFTLDSEIVFFSILRFKTTDPMLADVKEAIRLYQSDPDFVVGFDLVGQEDPLKPLIYYIDDLLYPKQQNPPIDLPYFFHAGETSMFLDNNNYTAIIVIKTTFVSLDIIIIIIFLVRTGPL